MPTKKKGVSRSGGCGSYFLCECVNMDIFKEFTFEAAHRLPHVDPKHKCGRLHGHSYRIEVHVTGKPGAESGWVVDFAAIKEVFQPIHETLDHRYLNEIEGLANPTTENLSRWIWQRLRP